MLRLSRLPLFLLCLSSTNGALLRSSVKGPSCTAIPMVNPSLNVTPKPVWVASFPGSGSEMFRAMIEAATGKESDEVYNRETNCENNPVICKTHFPLHIGGSKLTWGKTPAQRQEDFAREAIVLLRNPAKAMSSHFNYKYEEQNGIDSHSKQGPEEAWKEWRDRRFEKSLRAWKVLLSEWGKGPYDVSAYVSYEELTNEATGPAVLNEVVTVLRQSNPEMASADDLPCLWHQVVKKKPSKKRLGRSYEPSFTPDQQQAMLDVVDSILESYLKRFANASLRKTLLGYRDDIANHLRLDSPAISTV